MTRMDDRDLLREATTALVRTVDTLDDAGLRAASALPGWDRAQVVAHLALNAEGLAGSIDAAGRGEHRPQYRTGTAREDDIDELASAPAEELRARFLASTTLLAEALDAVQGDAWQARLERDPGGATFLVAEVPRKRIAEVVLHHLDLDAGARADDVSPVAAAAVVDALAVRLSRLGPVQAHAVDLDRTWPQPGEGPVVSGTAVELARWLSGRTPVVGLASTSGVVPAMKPW